MMLWIMLLCSLETICCEHCFTALVMDTCEWASSSLLSFIKLAYSSFFKIDSILFVSPLILQNFLSSDSQIWSERSPIIKKSFIPFGSLSRSEDMDTRRLVEIAWFISESRLSILISSSLFCSSSPIKSFSLRFWRRSDNNGAVRIIAYGLPARSSKSLWLRNFA